MDTGVGHNDPNQAEAEAAMIRCLNWTPLHMAASRGHQLGFQALLNGNPELAEALDSQQRSPLHLASANGHIEIVQALIGVRPDMCLARDRDGANPLHVAAMRGKIEVLDALFQANPHAARARVDSGERETILHLCVKYNQPVFLKRLLEKYFQGKEFVNAKDNDGNTILHLAVANRRFKIVQNVLTDTEIDLLATNASNQTAMDILVLGHKKGSELEGVDRDIESLFGLCFAKRKFQFPQIGPTEIAEKRNGIIVAATLIATLAFQSLVAPPGGVWQDDNDGHKSGNAVMAFNRPVLYSLFVYFNSLSFVSSLLTVYFIIMQNQSSKAYRNGLLAPIAMASIGSIIATYVISLFMVSSKWHAMKCAGKDKHTPDCTSFLHFARTWVILTFSSGGALLLWVMKIIIDRKMEIRRYEERVNRAGLANPAPLGEANA